MKQAAGDLVDAVAWHCYQSPIANYSVLDDFEFAYPGTLQFMTECTNYLPSAGSVNFEASSSTAISKFDWTLQLIVPSFT